VIKKLIFTFDELLLLRCPFDNIVNRSPQKLSLKEAKWSEKAVRSLVKKLNKSGTFEELAKALMREDPYTKCVTIPRSLDGRLQVNFFKRMFSRLHCVDGGLAILKRYFRVVL